MAKFGELTFGDKAKKIKPTKKITTEYCKKAVEEYLKSGGKITKLSCEDIPKYPVHSSPNCGPEDIDVALMYEGMVDSTRNLIREYMCRDNW